jgi:hypothetical protein
MLSITFRQEARSTTRPSERNSLAAAIVAVPKPLGAEAGLRLKLANGNSIYEERYTLNLKQYRALNRQSLHIMNGFVAISPFEIRINGKLVRINRRIPENILSKILRADASLWTILLRIG